MRLDAESRLRVRMTVWGLLASIILTMVAACSNPEPTFTERREADQRHYMGAIAEKCGGEPADYEWEGLYESPMDERIKSGAVLHRETGKLSWVSYKLYPGEVRWHPGAIEWAHVCHVEQLPDPGQADG